VVDKGHVGLKNYYPDVPVITPFKAGRGRPLTAEQEAFNRRVARRRIVVEHAVAQLSRFTVPRQVFRGKQRHRHAEVIRVVARQVNRRLTTRPLKSHAA
jgi:hypothetical protein